MKKQFFAHKTAIIDPPSEIGEGTKIWHFSHIMSRCKLGKNCNLGQNVMIAPFVTLGNNVKVQNNVSLYSGLVCEDDVFIGPSVVFTNILNPRSAIPRKSEYVNTLVEKGASIGANATIICGNKIGRYAFIGAGSVVTKDVLPHALVIGNPAKQVGWVSEYGHRLQFNLESIAICLESTNEYKLEKNRVTRIK